MRRAVSTDFARIPDCDVVTTRDARLCRSEKGTGPICRNGPKGASHKLDLSPFSTEVIAVSGPHHERRLFEQLAAECDATFVIAPETDRLLADRRELVDAVGGRFLGPTLEAIEFCTDKLRLAEHLLQCGLPAIETHPLEPDLMNRELPFPIVVKPRDGAGSQNTWLVADRPQLETLLRAWADSPESRPDIWQPYLPGLAESVGAIISHDGRRIEIFPPAEQRLSSDGRFRYLGGRVPAGNYAVRAIEQLVRRACECIGGLSGYVGFDLLLPADPPHEPVLVEINPRLTTSYLGYRAIAAENLAERILFPDRCPAKIRWTSSAVTFLPDGTVRMEQWNYGDSVSEFHSRPANDRAAKNTTKPAAAPVQSAKQSKGSTVRPTGACNSSSTTP